MTVKYTIYKAIIAYYTIIYTYYMYVKMYVF